MRNAQLRGGRGGVDAVVLVVATPSPLDAEPAVRRAAVQALAQIAAKGDARGSAAGCICCR